MGESFATRLQDSERGVAYAMVGGTCWVVTTTSRDYRLWTLRGPENYDFRKFYDDQGLDEFMETSHLGYLEWTFI